MSDYQHRPTSTAAMQWQTEIQILGLVKRLKEYAKAVPKSDTAADIDMAANLLDEFLRSSDDFKWNDHNHLTKEKHMVSKLVWATPDADRMIAEIARVSNPDNQKNPNIEGLLKYMMREGHVSPFEMANACIEVTTTRDIGRQILRHRSFQFQEFSQRYQSCDKLPQAECRECRLQDNVNRQNSIETNDDELIGQWNDAQNAVRKLASETYAWALANGIAKEQARALLPEGLTSSRLYMNGTMRSWIHYLQSRLHESTQKEHREIAVEILEILRGVAPVTMGAFFGEV